MKDQNQRIASQLQGIADLLRQQGASHFRFEAYEKAASAVRELSTPIGELLQSGGTDALVELRHIGEGIARVIEDIVVHGRSRVLARLHNGDDPEELFQTLPGIGPRLAECLHVELEIETLADLRQACSDGRLAGHPGFGKKRIEALGAVLDLRLGTPRRPDSRSHEEPSIELLLEVDRIYRSGARAGRFRKVAPRRQNPKGRAWLPIAHLDIEGWHFTALFSNTALAHKLARTHDWVILYYYDAKQREGQCTVVTERRGPLAGKRVVRGRESECQELYRRSASAGSQISSMPTAHSPLQSTTRSD